MARCSQVGASMRRARCGKATERRAYLELQLSAELVFTLPSFHSDRAHQRKLAYMARCTASSRGGVPARHVHFSGVHKGRFAKSPPKCSVKLTEANGILGDNPAPQGDAIRLTKWEIHALGYRHARHERERRPRGRGLRIASVHTTQNIVRPLSRTGGHQTVRMAFAKLNELHSGHVGNKIALRVDTQLIGDLRISLGS